MGGANLPQQKSIPKNLTEAQNAERIQKQGMSDQGIVSLGQLKKEAVGTYNDIKNAVSQKLGGGDHQSLLGRDAKAGQFDGVKAQQTNKSNINMTADEAMMDL
jgi:hypothetical protein